MQLTASVGMGIMHDQGISIGYIQPGFDDGCRDEALQLARENVPWF